MPSKEYSGTIETVNFVFETEFKKLKQPFFKPIYLLHLVTRGEGKLIVDLNEYNLKKGSVYVTYPGSFYSIEAGDDFQYAYISFIGQGAEKLLEKLDFVKNNPVRKNCEHLIDLWLSSLRRLDEQNANILSEAILLYTLSFVNTGDDKILLNNKDNVFQGILDYLEKHYTEPEINLSRVSGIFNYTHKYLSYLFKKNMGVGFCSYINELRLNFAFTLIEDGKTNITKISEMSGFSDPLYFSKVFKKKYGISPSEAVKNKGNENSV